MTTVRTKQQIAFDGVRVVWCDELPIHTIQSSLIKHRSVDGVIVVKRSTDDLSKNYGKKEDVFVNNSLHHKRCMQGIDGVRVPWRRIPFPGI